MQTIDSSYANKIYSVRYSEAIIEQFMDSPVYKKTKTYNKGTSFAKCKCYKI